MTMKLSSSLVEEIERYAPDTPARARGHARAADDDERRGKAVVKRWRIDLLGTANHPTRWLNTDQAALYVGLERSTLALFRREGRGPRYVRMVGNNGKPSKYGRVRYARHELDAWLRKHTYPEMDEQPAPPPSLVRKERR